MSTLELEHLKHSSSSSNNLSVHSDGSLTLGMLQGNVGIGTASPTVKLEAVGDIKASVSAANAQISAITAGASNYATFTATNGSRSYSMQIRPDQSNSFAIRDETGGGNRLLIDTAGRVTKPNTPAFKFGVVTRNATGSDRIISTNNGDSFNYQTRDTHNVGSHFSTTTGRFTCPVAGTYMFYCSLMRHGNNGTVLENRIKKNGSLMYARAYAGAYTSAYQQSIIVTTSVCAVNDYIEFFVQGTTSIYQDDSYVGGYLLG